MRHKTRVSALERRAKPGAVHYRLWWHEEIPEDAEHVIVLRWEEDTEHEEHAAPGALGADSSAPPAGAE